MLFFFQKKTTTFVDNFHWNFIMKRYFRRNNFMFKSTISFWIYTTRLIYFAGTDVTIVTYMELRYTHLCFYYQIIFNAHLIFHISRSNILKHSKKEWDIPKKNTMKTPSVYLNTLCIFWIINLNLLMIGLLVNQQPSWEVLPFM